MADCKTSTGQTVEEAWAQRVALSLGQYTCCPDKVFLLTSPRWWRSPRTMPIAHDPETDGQSRSNRKEIRHQIKRL